MAGLQKYWSLALVIQHNQYVSRGALQILLERSVIVGILDDPSHHVAWLRAVSDDIIILQLGQLVVKEDGSIYISWSQLFF